MRVLKTRLGTEVLALVIATLFMFVACSAGNDDTNPGTDADTDSDSDTDTDTDIDTDSDSDSDSDTGTDTDTITDPDFDMCTDYPPSDDNFQMGSVIRNYLFWDVFDEQIEICEYWYDFRRLLIKFNTLA